MSYHDITTFYDTVTTPIAGRQARPPVDPQGARVAALRPDNGRCYGRRPEGLGRAAPTAAPCADHDWRHPAGGRPGYNNRGYPPDYQPAPAVSADRMRRISPVAGVVGDKERPSATLIVAAAMEPFRTSFPPFHPPPNGRFAPVSCYNLGKIPVSEAGPCLNSPALAPAVTPRITRRCGRRSSSSMARRANCWPRRKHSRRAPHARRVNANAVIENGSSSHQRQMTPMNDEIEGAAHSQLHRQPPWRG
jgi:hypothetical protein